MTGLPMHGRTCKEVGSPKPCRYAGVCHAARQELMSSYRVPLWGKDCWAFVLLSQDVNYSGAERAAIASESDPPPRAA